MTVNEPVIRVEDGSMSTSSKSNGNADGLTLARKAALKAHRFPMDMCTTVLDGVNILNMTNHELFDAVKACDDEFVNSNVAVACIFASGRTGWSPGTIKGKLYRFEEELSMKKVDGCWRIPKNVLLKWCLQDSHESPKTNNDSKGRDYSKRRISERIAIASENECAEDVFYALDTTYLNEDLDVIGRYSDEVYQADFIAITECMEHNCKNIVKQFSQAVHDEISNLFDLDDTDLDDEEDVLDIYGLNAESIAENYVMPLVKYLACKTQDPPFMVVFDTRRFRELPIMSRSDLVDTFESMKFSAELDELY